MTKQFEVYKCDVCGNLVEVLFAGEGTLVCCGKPMTLQEEKTKDENSGEKHVPVFEKLETGETIVKVGSTPHPMSPEHHVQFIEVFANDRILRKYLEPNEKPEFLIKLKDGLKHAREYCNLHGLWKGDNYVN